jgi:hypothetical protein
MNEDPILKLAVHLEKHRDHSQAFFSTRALRTLLERLGAANGKLAKVTNERDNLCCEVEKLVIALASAASEIRELQGRVDELTRAGN